MTAKEDRGSYWTGSINTRTCKVRILSSYVIFLKPRIRTGLFS